MRTSYEVAKSIARKVILAQDASDYGKGIPELEYMCSDRYPKYMGYTAKNTYILEALKEISTNKPCGWNFYVCPNQPDQNGYDSVITYFQLKLDGVRYEISFHTPADQAFSLKRFFGKGRKTHWNGKLGQSREDCQRLAWLFNI